MNIETLIIQRYYYNFREGFFNHLYSVYPKFRLINSTRSVGRVTVHKDVADNSPYIYRKKSININDGIVWFPFCFYFVQIIT
jgi:hypothetical protein